MRSSSSLSSTEKFITRTSLSLSRVPDVSCTRASTGRELTPRCGRQQPPGVALPDFDGLLDWTTLQPWIIASASLPGDGPVVAVEQLTGGSQNNIFRLLRASGDQ